MKAIKFLALFTIIPTMILGQVNDESRAVKFHEKALKYYHASAYDNALDEVNKAIKADKNYIKAWLLAGDIHSLKGSKQQAIEDYKKAISIDSNFFIPAYYILANLLFDEGRYAESIMYYGKYANYPKIREAEKARLDKNMETAKFRMDAFKNPVPFKPVNLGSNVNSKGYEFVNYISPDNERIYFTRRMVTGDRRDEQFFYCRRLTDSTWTEAIDIGPPVNTEGDEGAMAVSPDGQYLFFSGCESINGFGSCDLYVSRLDGDTWEEPFNLGPVVNTPGWESQPSFSSDGKTLYFVSNRPGGYGGSDIWITHLLDNGEWSEPYNAGEIINTKEAERGPFIHPDAKTLYFSSNGHTGMGQGDIFFSVLDNGRWSQPVNLGYPVNTKDDEITLIVDNQGNYAYYSSMMENGFGLQDIYMFELPKAAKPEKVSYIKGRVYDSITRQPLMAAIRLLDPVSGDTIISSNSNIRDGSYLLVIPSGNQYALNVEKDGYLFYSAHFNMIGENNFIDPFIKDIPLKPLKEGESIVLRNIFFATDSFNLLDASKAELDHLVRLLVNNKTLHIEISGHTDNVGSEEYNNDLSTKRAKSVYEHLVKSGIVPSRLRYKGYGYSKPLSDNTSEAGRALNRRTEIYVTSL
ncbi:MAG TPA: OmpA family protein [Lentimicrobium sp.]|nr:OmpA family protein [Lentimicrobium sp.]